MIVRILAEGQYDVDGTTLEAIHRLDDEVMQAIMNNDAARFHALYGKLVALARTGRRIEPHEFAESDIILPAADTSLAEAKKLFSGTID